MPPVLLNPTIVIVDVDAGIPPAELAKAASSLQHQAREHVGSMWGVTASVRAATAAAPPKAGEWRLELREVPTIDGALGYHDEQPDGSPILYVFPALCAQEGDSWTSCASHEIAEALVDPMLTDIKQAADGTLWCCEVADAVEADTYLIDGVAVSNFCGPFWFAPPKDLTGVRYDWMGLCTKDHEIRDGGYGQTYDKSTGWSQVGAMRAYRKTLHDLGLGRAARRAA